MHLTSIPEKLVTTAWRGAAGTVGHGLRTVSWATGVAREAGGTVVSLAGSVLGSREVTAADEASEPSEPSEDSQAVGATGAPGSAETGGPAEEPHDPRDDLPGPDVVAPAVPRPDDLPEPVVIEAADAPEDESFHNEPKPASRDSARGSTTTDAEEVQGYEDEVVAAVEEDRGVDGVDVVNPAGTSGTGVSFNPDTAESDLHQPGTPPLADPAVMAEVRSETETLRRAAERDPG